MLSMRSLADAADIETVDSSLNGSLSIVIFNGANLVGAVVCAAPVEKERLLIIDRRRFRCTVVLDSSRSHRLLVLAILRALRELKLFTLLCADD